MVPTDESVGYFRSSLAGLGLAHRATRNLSELELTLGEVAGAVGEAEQSVT